MARKQWFSVGELTMEGASNGAVTVLSKDASGNILQCSGTSAPSAAAGYAKGCIFIKTDASASGLYENTGSTTSCTFSLLGTVTAGEITLAEGSVLVGNSSGVAAALSAKTDGQILVGNGTTITSVAVSGDVTMSNAGAVTIGAKKVVNTMIAAAAGTVLGGTTTSGDVTAIDNSTSGSIVIGQGAATTCAAHVLSGDATMTNAGVVTLAYPKVAAITSQALLFSAFTDNTNATGYIDITTQIPAHSIVLGWKAVVTTGFSGDTTATIEVGISGGVANFSANTANSVLTSSTEVGSASAVATSYCAAATTARVTVTGGADFTSISAGSMVVTLYIVRTA